MANKFKDFYETDALILNFIFFLFQETNKHCKPAYNEECATYWSNQSNLFKVEICVIIGR